MKTRQADFIFQAVKAGIDSWERNPDDIFCGGKTDFNFTHVFFEDVYILSDSADIFCNDGNISAKRFD